MFVYLTALVGFSANAQEGSTDTGDETIDEIVVNGVRSSQRSAIQRKQAATTMTDSIVAEDIGEFPDKNVGEALQRITGVQLDRDFGEGSNISIRGVEPGLVRIEVNGVTQLGMGNVGLGGAVDFRDLSSELVKALDVIKGSEARMVEGGIGGTVKVVTRKPNDFKDNYLRMNLENQYNDLGETNDLLGNITGVYKFSDRLGILANITASEKSTTSHALRNTEWVLLGDYDNSPERTFINPDYASITDVVDCPDSTCQRQWFDFRPRIPRIGMWYRDEDRVSANTMLQYAFSDNLTGHFGLTHNKRGKKALDHNLHLEVPADSRIDTSTIVTDANHNAVQFTTTRADIVNRTLQFDWDQETNIFEGGLDFTAGNWEISALAGFSELEQFVDSTDMTVRAQEISGITVNLTPEGAPVWDFNDGFRGRSNGEVETGTPFVLDQPSSWFDRSDYIKTPINHEADEGSLKIDVAYNLENNFLSSIRGGIRGSDESLSWERIRTQRVTRLVGRQGANRVWTLADQVSLFTPNNTRTQDLFGSFDPGVPFLSNYLAVEPDGYIPDYLELVETTDGFRPDNNETVPRPLGFYEVDRASIAAYLQADFATEIGGLPVWGNFGARFISSDTDTLGNAQIDVIVDVLDDMGNPTGQTERLVAGEHPQAFLGLRTVSNSYSELLPSVNVNVELIPDKLVAYFGAAKVLAHPKAEDLNVAATCTIRLDSQAILNGEVNSCSAGNPALDPYLADQWDIALSWYPNEDTIVSGAYFQKKIDSFIVGPSRQEDVNFFGDGTLYEVNQKTNGEGAETKGFELQASTFFTMLPSPFNNMGASFNYTRMDADRVELFNALTAEPLPFPSLSEDSYNLSLYYETDTLTARLAYNYRDEYLLSPADRSGNPVYVDDSGFLDAKFIYRPENTNFKFYIDARNLTEQERLINAGPGRLTEILWSGRTFSVGFIYTAAR
jgi:iron complex outermembrane receptor protein